jgi:aspartate-semialdehyde dehydrogenase
MKSRDTGLNIAVLGVTGAVGREVVSIIGERRLPVGEIKGYATAESVGVGVDYLDDEVIARDIKDVDFTGTDVVFIAIASGSSARGSRLGSSNLDSNASGLVSLGSGSAASSTESAGASIAALSMEYCEKALASGALVIEVGAAHAATKGRSAYVVPEINGKAVEESLSSGGEASGVSFSCPCGASSALSIVLAPLARKAKIERVVVSTYQAVSNSGRGGMDELWKQTVSLFNGEDLEPAVFPQQIAFNCFPHVGEFDEDGISTEEARIVAETRAILDNSTLPIAVTAAQIPVFNCCALSVNLEFAEELKAEVARKILAESFGVIVQDEPAQGTYPACFELGGSDAVYVGRIRKDNSVKYGLSLWVVVDNLRKGSALNGVEILELALGSKRWASNRLSGNGVAGKGGVPKSKGAGLAH